MASLKIKFDLGQHQTCEAQSSAHLIQQYLSSMATVTAYRINLSRPLM